MTRITRMVMRGFKSFGEKTDLIFDEKYNCILGPNGSGKCLRGEARVSLADGTSLQIRDLVEQSLKKGLVEKIDDGFIGRTQDPVTILCLNTNTYTIESRPVTAFVKRTAPETLLLIKTRSGRSLVATEYHPLFILDNGTLRSVKAEELQEGISVAVPRELPFVPRNFFFFELLDLITKEDNIYVPYSQDIEIVLREIKAQKTWKELAIQLSIPHIAIKAFLDKQALNFAYAVKILRAAHFSSQEIISFLPFIKAKVGAKLYKIPWNNTSSFSRFLGYLLAEGRVSENEGQIWFTNGTEEIIADYCALVRELFGIEPVPKEYKSSAWDIILYCKPYARILSKFTSSLTGAGNKSVTNLYLAHASEEHIGHLLSGLYSGDGYVSKSTVELTTKSISLAQAIETMLLRLGILFRTKDVVKIATNSGFTGSYKMITISGVPSLARFASFVPLVHTMKRNRLFFLIQKVSNPNLDLVPVNSLVKTVVYDYSLSPKKLKKLFPKIDAYCYNQCTPSRDGIQQLCTTLFSSYAQEHGASASLMQLKSLATSSIYWDEIISVERIPSSDQWVYDLSVDQHHNFIANNFFVHNSNIGDALCFVLGKGSAKGLRAEKSANLIYNGGKSKKPAKEGEVSIYFDNASKIFPEQTPEVKISRIIRENGQSIYRINDQRKTRQEMLELLTLANIDPDGYNIVLQGDIVRLVEMSSIERRQIIEEIAGIGVYEEKKQKTLNELGKVDQKLTEADIILAERKTYLKELKQERDQAEKYKELADTITKNKATYLSLQMGKKKKQKDALEKEISGYQEKISKKDQEITALKVNVGEKKAQIQKITKEVEEKGEKEQVQILHAVEKLKVDIVANKDRIKLCTNEIQRMTTRKDQLVASSGEIEEKSAELQKQVVSQEKEKVRLSKEIDQIQGKIDTFRKKNQLEGTENIDKEIEELDKFIEEKQKEVQALREKQQELLREKDKIDYQIHSADEKIDKVLELEKENKDEIEKLKQMKQEFKKATLELNQTLQEDATLAGQFANAREKMQRSQDELAKLEARQTRIRESSSWNIAIQKVLEEGSKLGTVYGILSDLGHVKSSYALALEIAAGPKLKSIVVDTDKTAENCITFLKKNKFGIATFLPLNKIKPASPDASAKQLATSNGVHGFATDLVSFEPKFKNIFSYVFGNTLVVDNLAVARRIGVGTVRMTTLEGDLVELSGAMQGGYRERQKNALGFQEKEVVESLKETETAFAESQRLVSLLQEKRNELEKNITRLRAFKANLEGDIITKEKALHLESDDLDASKKMKKELEEQAKHFEKHLEALQLQISSYNKDFAAAKIKKQQLRDKISQLRNPLLLAELTTFEQKKSELKQKVIELDVGTRNIQMQIANILLPEQENIAKIIKQHEKEQQDFVAEIASLEKTIVAQEEELKEKEKKQKEFYGAFKDLFKHRDALNEGLQKLENTIILSE